jgi:ACS family hexuronate transporter-like MFS transporter
MIKIPKLPWLIAGMLLFSTLLNYTDRLTLSVVAGSVLREFSMTERDYGQVVSLFMVAYAVMYAGSGYVVDRLGTRPGFALFVSVWSAAQALNGFALGKWSLAACQFGLGFGEPGNFPAGVKAAHEWFLPHQRAAAVGLFNAGSSAGAALGAPVAAFLTVRYGWRSWDLSGWLCGWSFAHLRVPRVGLTPARKTAWKFPGPGLRRRKLSPASATRCGFSGRAPATR